MGLDMYLTKHIYIGGEYDDGITGTVSIKKGNDSLFDAGKTIEVDPHEIDYIVVRAGYWRKANAIHGWIVNNCANGVDDCRPVYFWQEKRKELLSLCKKVKEDHSLAPSLLPVTGGLFFGTYQYDDWYFEDIDLTISILEKTVDDENNEYYYKASW